MKISLQWLSDFIDIPWKPAELAERLTMAGIEIEAMVRQGEGLDGVIVAEILKCDRHPNADRLSVCEVTTGDRKHQIVCGAKNHKVGDKVPLAVPGCKLPGGMEIKSTKLRGIQSDGMLCSAVELGLSEDADGLLILPASAKVGAPFQEAFGLDDTVIDVEITPNRPDLLSHWGIAREAATLAGGTLRPPRPWKGTASSNETFAVEIKDPDLCPRYSARLLRKIRVGPSPEWMQKRLRAAGQRPINNVVDITNYVMLEVGQPLHAFDTRFLEGRKIVVRRAARGEKMRTLDDADLELDAETLVIADSRKPVALAGVMGGLHSGIQDDTVEVLLESAGFKPSNIRRTSKKYQIRSESSYRFERGVDPQLAALASDLATRLLVELAGAEVAGPLNLVEPEAARRRQIQVRRTMIDRMTGFPLPDKEIEEVFGGLGFTILGREAQADGVAAARWKLEVPTYRVDMLEEVDVLEEIVRIYGIDRIPARPVEARWVRLQKPGPFFEHQRFREIASDLGFDEIQTYTLVSEAGAHEIHGEAFPREQILANPLNAEMDALRADLFMGMIGIVARNHAQRNLSLQFFEIGRVFEGLKESTHLSLALCGNAPAPGWEGAERPFDFFDLKGRLEWLLAESGCGPVEWKAASHKAFSLFITLYRDGEEIGFIGEVSGAFTASRKIEGAVYYAELDLDLLLSAGSTRRKFAPLAQFPAVQRDLAIILEEAAPFADVFNSLRQIGSQAARAANICLESVALFDIFRSRQIGDGRKSMAFRFVYRSLEKTLTDGQVNEVHNAVTRQVKETLSCEVRV